MAEQNANRKGYANKVPGALVRNPGQSWYGKTDSKDEQWAVFHPYGASVAPGGEREFEVRIVNHSPIGREFKVTPHGWNGLEVLTEAGSLKLKPRESGRVKVRVRAPEKPGHGLITADVESEGMAFTEWVEALVTVE